MVKPNGDAERLEWQQSPEAQIPKASRPIVIDLETAGPISVVMTKLGSEKIDKSRLIQAIHQAIDTIEHLTSHANVPFKATSTILLLEGILEELENGQKH